VRHRIVLPFVLSVTATLLLAAAGPAVAGGPDRDNRFGRNEDGNRVVVNGDVNVVESDKAENVFLVNGDATIDGHVEENVVVLNGNIRVSGEVGDNVIAVNGRAIIQDGAQVGGDVRSSDRPVVAEGATVDGDIEETNFANAFDVLGFVLYVLWWIAVTISLFVLGLLFLWLAPRAADAGVETARTRVGPSIGWGFAMTIGLPIVSLIVLFTIVGTPLGFVGLLSLAPLFALGYVTSAYFLGRLILRQSNRYLVFLLGWGILRFVELFPVLGHLVSFAAVLYGLGALTVTAWRAARGTRPPGESVADAPGAPGAPTEPAPAS
jgi:hypothetical protein